MDRAGDWTLRGVGVEARDAAQDAARRYGMSVGEWLEEAIARQAAAQGVKRESRDQDERTEAAGDRLSRFARRDEPGARQTRRSVHELLEMIVERIEAIEEDIGANKRASRRANAA